MAEGQAPCKLRARRRAMHLLAGLAWPACGLGASVLSGCVSPAPIGNGPMPVQVAPGVFMLPGARGEIGPDNRGRIGNVAFIVGPRGVLVVNSGVSHRQGLATLAAIRRVTDLPIRQLLLTHVRQEFLFGATAFRAQGIPVLMHPAAARLMAARCENCLKSLVRTLGAEEMAGTQVIRPDATTDPADTASASVLVDIGRPLRLLSAGRGGHSSGPGDLALLDEQTGSLVAGGWLDAHSVPDIQDADPAGWREALALVSTLQPRHILPGHGPAGGPALAEAIVRYLDQLERRTAALLQSGTALSDVADLTQLPEFADWDQYDTIHRRNASLVFLRHERALLQRP